ncbi:CPBP family intramembrane metalloprotease [Ruficoccus amylovorans]|uniref:CPBP family intramembrane metalloprotease n=1 Tax=Ruficoccus amylovorans TaxID=1804625 RepID=A0A842HE49_9BACT|nr:CPBP family glutamic-type intramembrane protease [Ruficoccus amylovorans]MBC2594519.1 CPBP family intramembrane metalloprotease [Ruficoccus amylovorans]
MAEPYPDPAGQAVRVTAARRAGLMLEFALLCVALPTLIIVGRLAGEMILFLWAACLYCGIVYRLRYFRGWGDVWRWREVNTRNLSLILPRFVLVAAAMAAFLYFYDPDRMLQLPREKFGFMLLLFVLYPLLSALPQEFIFCTFFFRRYRTFFPARWAMVTASAVVFAYAHVLFINPVAPALSLIGGLIFASTYARTRSLALVTLEHALYGNFLFFIGLGWYFYGGAVPRG